MKNNKSHPLHDLVQRVRKIFLKLDFQEVENPIFIPEDEVYKQYGSEAPVVLDRCYYLAGLPRPEIGLSKKKIKEIKEISPKIDIDKFQEILRKYKEGKIGGDDLAEKIVNEFDVKGVEAFDILNLFPDFKKIKPQPTKITLRSHMTAGWFLSLQKMQNRYSLPLHLFSIGLRFRREQKLDATHLRAHYGASCILMGENINLEKGKKFTKKILQELGFEEIEFEVKPATSNYYQENTELEVFSEGIEIADCGLYSKRALENYGIDCPVFNLGFGLERILMLQTNKKDVRKIIYPQFYQELELSDEEILQEISIDKKPITDQGKEIVKKFMQEAQSRAQEDAPCEFLLWEGDIKGEKIKVYLFEEEEGTKLLGPAAQNEIYVHGGNIYGIPKEKKFNLEEVKKNGVKVNFSYLEAIGNWFAYQIEKMLEEREEVLKDNGKGKKWQIKMSDTPADINIKISQKARKYITSNNKEISLSGPIFTGVKIKKR